MRRVLALSGGPTVPSARFRVGQFAGRLEPWGIDLVHRPSRIGTYPPPARWRRPAWLVATIADRLPDVVASHRYDVTLLQREFVSTLKTLEGLTRRPRVFDVDDALWLLPRGGFAARIAGRCDRVICGNSFLAEYFGRFNRDVVILPTAVDTQRFSPAPRPSRDEVVIGWSGSSGGFKYLDALDEPLAAVMRERRHVRFRLLADRPRVFPGVAADRVEYVPWSPASEVGAISTMDIGVMPLDDSPWERGKCSYKMLLYLACGVPAVVSPVGMNAEVLAAADLGRGPTSAAEWRAALLELVDDASLRARLGEAGRGLVQRRYSWDAVAPALAAALA